MSESEKIELTSMLEALLFVASEPTTISQLATALDITNHEVEAGLKELEGGMAQRGLRIQRHQARIQMTTAPETAAAIEKFLGLEAVTRLSRAALETLAIVAYQQPVTRPQIESVRGVSCDGVLRSLLGKGLIQEIGRAEGPGRPILYSTTPDFLQHFGLSSLGEMPPLKLDNTEEAEQPADSVEEET